LEPRSLRSFQSVAEFGSVSRAAEALRISQPAVSRQIRRLEDSLGVALFVRRGHGVTLTEAGRSLLERSQVILRQIDLAQIEVRNGSPTMSGTITLAVPPAAGLFLVPALVQRCAAEFPNIFLKVVAGYSGYIHEWLLRGSADLACLHDPLPQRDFRIIPLVREEVFLVGKPGSFPFRGGHVRSEQLARVGLILPSRPNASRRLLDSWVSARGLSLNIKMEVDDSSIIRALLKDGVGFSLLTQGGFRSEVRHKELAALPFRPRVHWPLGLMMPTNHPRLALIGPIAKVIRETVRDLSHSGAWPGAVSA
jgi:LysR family transcriptional regulator, nitrogen assimilation regulatory protein